MSIEPDFPVTVFYLATEPFRGGFRWLIRQFGAPRPLETGNETFGTEADARKGGKRAFIRVSARAGPRRIGRTSPGYDEATGDGPVTGEARRRGAGDR